jgi:cellulose synthase/poly-beta-1,6-N-acetylglucosamine synthase-like glycosyltransferase
MLTLFFWIVVGGLVAYHGFNFLMVALAAFELSRQDRGEQQRPTLPGVAVIVPAYNESLSIVRTVSSILRSSYPDFQVIVVSDGSTDRTLRALTDAFALRPSNLPPDGPLATQKVRAVFASETDVRLLVVDKRNGGKADALNAGINMASKPLVLATDADVLFDARALFFLAVRFARCSETVAASGMIRPYNGCTLLRNRVARAGMPSKLLEACQVVEYLRSYGVGRLFFNRFGGHLIISGAFGMFDRELLIELRGYQTHAVGEDMELVARIHRHCVEQGRPYRIEFSADALCYTEAPHTRRDFGSQRTRWHHGLLTTLRIHRYIAGNPRYGSIGVVTFPYFLLELYAPALELIGWLLLPALWVAGSMPAPTVFLFVAGSVLMSMSVSLMAILLDAIYFGHFRRVSDRVILVMAALSEPFWYRPLTVYYRLRAFSRYYRTIHLKTAWTSPARAPQPVR